MLHVVILATNLFVDLVKLVEWVSETYIELTTWVTSCQVVMYVLKVAN